MLNCGTGNVPLTRYLIPCGCMVVFAATEMRHMLMAEGEIIKKAQSDSAKAMLQGPYSKGAVAAAPRLGKVKKTQDGKSIYVTFGGKQHGSRLAEIAFLNEFGKHNQAARPFIREANENHADRAVDAAQKIYDQYLARKGF